jgi:carbon storage regulator
MLLCRLLAASNPLTQGGQALLVLSRKKNESIEIQTSDGIIEVVVVAILGDKVKLGFQAPPEVPVHRKEIADNIRRDGPLK